MSVNDFRSKMKNFRNAIEEFQRKWAELKRDFVEWREVVDAREFMFEKQSDLFIAIDDCMELSRNQNLPIRAFSQFRNRVYELTESIPVIPDNFIIPGWFYKLYRQIMEASDEISFSGSARPKAGSKIESEIEPEIESFAIPFNEVEKMVDEEDLPWREIKDRIGFPFSHQNLAKKYHQHFPNKEKRQPGRRCQRAQ